MKKLMALCLSLLMVLSMCSFTAMAKQTTTVGQAVGIDLSGTDFGEGWAFSSDPGFTKTVSGGVATFALSNGNTTMIQNAAVYTFPTHPSLLGGRYYILEAMAHFPSPMANVYRINLGLQLGSKRIGAFAATTGKTKIIAVKPDVHFAVNATDYVDTVNDSARIALPTTAFVPLKIVIDTQTGKVEYWQNGTQTGEYTITEADGINLTTEPASVKLFVDMRSSSKEKSIELQFKDVSLYSANDKVLTNAEKVDEIASLITKASIAGDAATVTKSLTLDGGYAENELYTNGDVTVTWTSLNPEYIANDGTFLKYADFPTSSVTATMKATISSGDVSEEVTIPLTIGNGLTQKYTNDFATVEGGFFTATQTADEKQATSSGTPVYNDDGTPKMTINSTETKFLSSIANFSKNARIIINADFKYTYCDGEDKYNDQIGGISFDGMEGQSRALGVYLNPDTEEVLLSVTRGYAADDGNRLTFSDAATVSYPMPASIKAKIGKDFEGTDNDVAAEWITATFDYNVLSQTYEVYLDGVLINTDAPVAKGKAIYADTTGSVLRGMRAQIDRAGEVSVDNLTVSTFDDADYVETHAALSAAALLYVSKTTRPTLKHGIALKPHTISRSWIIKTTVGETTKEYLDVDETNKTAASYADNPARYPVADITDGPTLTYKVNGNTVTSITATKPERVAFTITATSSNGMTLSKTYSTGISPVVIRGFGGHSGALNAVWLDGQSGTEKIVVAQYNRGQLVQVVVHNLDGNTNYTASTGLVKGISTLPPKANNAADQVKFFVISGSDGITPVSLVNDEFHD